MTRKPRRKAEVPAPPPPRRAKHPRNTLNELDGERWLFFTRSVLRTSYPRELGHDLRKVHGANKPPRLMQALVEFFTRAGGRVLDPFAQSVWTRPLLKALAPGR